MPAKRMYRSEDVVYSTHPEFEYEYANIEEPETLPAAKQHLSISLGKRKIDGASVTTITGFVGKRIDLVAIEEELQHVCRTCSFSRMYDIILKGDVRKRAYIYLRNSGFSVRFAEAEQ
jgi:translation initiation factor 1